MEMAAVSGGMPRVGMCEAGTMIAGGIIGGAIGFCGFGVGAAPPGLVGECRSVAWLAISPTLFFQ